MSGVYFVWNNDKIQYVGKSVKLSGRLRAKSHHKLSLGDMVSWIEFGLDDLDYAEMFYIGTCRPPRNGRAA